MIITTESGSKYHIGVLSKTWTRLEFTPDSGPLRSAGGEFDYLGPVEVGMPLVMFCPPINPPHRRMIITSPVIQIDEDHEETK